MRLVFYQQGNGGGAVVGWPGGFRAVGRLGVGSLYCAAGVAGAGIRGQNAEDAEVAQRTQKNSKKGWGFGSGFSASTSSFPRRWESMPTHAQSVDSRLRGNDGCGA